MVRAGDANIGYDLRIAIVLSDFTRAQMWPSVTLRPFRKIFDAGLNAWCPGVVRSVEQTTERDKTTDESPSNLYPAWKSR